MSEDSPQGRVAVKAFVFFCAFLALLLVLTMPGTGELSPHDQGQIAGRATFSALLPVVIVAILARRSDRGYSWLKFGLLSFLFFCGFHVLTTVGQMNERMSKVISAAEGVVPSIVGTSLCQAGVPFQVDAPRSDFAFLPERSQNAPNLRAWQWEREETGERVVVQILKDGARSPSDFREFMRGVRSSADGQPVQSERLTTDAIPYEATLSFALAQGGSVDFRCLSHGPSQDPSWVVCVTTMSVDSTELATLRDSLRLSPC